MGENLAKAINFLFQDGYHISFALLPLKSAPQLIPPASLLTSSAMATRICKKSSDLPEALDR
jgi:hypothetical protein